MLDGKERVILRSVILAVALALVACSDEAPKGNAPPLKITMTQLESGQWSIRYDYAAAVREIDLGPTLGDYRPREWRIDGDDAEIAVEDGRDFIRTKTNSALHTVAVLAAPAPAELVKGYQPFAPMGDGGVLIYTGHFIPFEDGRRAPAVLDIVASAPNSLEAFGESAPSFSGWESPYRHPAFIYAGRVASHVNGNHSMVADSEIPGWIADEAATLAPGLIDGFTQVFDRALPTRPELFLSWGGGEEAGRLYYKGDALPGQFLISLVGGGWRDDGATARDLFRRATAHEGAHLWQTEARPRSDAVPIWIHEGGAEALAAEAMVAGRFWSAADKRRNQTAARDECARLLDGRSLAAAEARGEWRASYACGHVLNDAAAGAAGAGDFWREFVRRAAAGDGYDEQLFLNLTRERAGEDMAAAIAMFTRTAEARPDLAIDRLFELAAAHE